MLRQLLKDSAIYGAASLLSRAISFFLLPLYTRVLSPHDYGAIELVFVLVALVNVTVALEISQGVARYFIDSPEDERPRYASTALWFTAATYTTFLMVALLAAPFIARALLADSLSASDLRIALVSIWLGGFYYLAQNQLRWQLRPMRFAAASITFTLATITSTAILVLVFDLGIRGVFLGQALGNIGGAVVAFWFLRGTYRLEFVKEHWQRMLRFSLPLVPSSIAVFLNSYVDRIAISRLLTIADVGIYGVAFRVASVIGLAVIGIQGALTPLILAHHRDPETPAQLARIFRLFMLVALGGAIGLTVFAAELVSLLAAPEFSDAAVLLPLLVPALLLSTMYIFAPGPMLAERTGTFAVVNIAAAVVNVVLNVALVPTVGLPGSAIATLVSAALGFGAILAVSQRLYPVPHEWLPLAGAVIVATSIAAGVAATGLLTRMSGDDLRVLAAKIAVCIIGLACIAALLLRRGELHRMTHLLPRSSPRSSSGEAPRHEES
jgi:O-antigen/teichoic acid export membrane protein